MVVMPGSCGLVLGAKPIFPAIREDDAI